MTKNINTLVEDIYGVFNTDVTVSPEVAKAFGDDLARVVIEQVTERKEPHLRLSNLGVPCRRKLWYSINVPELAEKMSGATRIKFLIGHISEAVVLFLARLAGHSVTDEQKEVSLHGVKGHIDGLIDGELVDIKSASPPSFRKFLYGLVSGSDSFGYINQLTNYGNALDKQRGHFLPVDKVSGELHLDSHELPEKDTLREVSEVREMLANNEPPDRGFEDVKDGESGNRKLGVACSYCDFKHTCYPGLQVWKYSKETRYLTKVVRTPNPTKGSGFVQS